MQPGKNALAAESPRYPVTFSLKQTVVPSREERGGLDVMKYIFCNSRNRETARRRCGDKVTGEARIFPGANKTIFAIRSQ